MNASWHGLLQQPWHAAALTILAISSAWHTLDPACSAAPQPSHEYTMFCPPPTQARLAGRGRARRTRSAGRHCCSPHPAAQTARAAGPSTAALARHTMVPGRLGRSVERRRQAAAPAGPRPAARPRLPCSGCDPVSDQRMLSRAGRLGEQQGGRAGLEVTRRSRLRGDRGKRSITQTPLSTSQGLQGHGALPATGISKCGAAAWPICRPQPSACLLQPRPNWIGVRPGSGRGAGPESLAAGLAG